MSKKIPGIFRKPYPEKRFKGKLLKFIEQPGDKEFLVSVFDLNEGVYTLKEALAKPLAEDASADEKKARDGTVKRLIALAKAIKINRQGVVKILPLTAFTVLVASLVGFFMFFMDPVLEGLLEKGLQNVFEARCDVNRFHLGLLRFRISIGSVSVANRDEPMKNLFETGRLEIRLKPQAILRGKVYIEELRADTLRFGTPRTVSGALPEYAARIAARRNKPPAPPIVDLSNFDAMGLLNREYDKLASPKAFQSALSAYDEAKTRWQNQYTRANAQVAELRAAVQPILNINVNNIRSVDEVKKIVSDINTLVNSVENARDEVEVIVDGVQGDISTARNLERTAREALQADIDHLKSYLDLGSGSALKALEPSIREILSDEVEQYIAYGQRALEALDKLKALQARIPKSEPKPQKQVFKGRTVAFPTQAYPVFYLGQMASDFTLGDWNWGFDLRSVSSDPDLTGRPTELMLSLAEQGSYGRTVRFDGSADFRTNASRYFSAAVTGGNFPLDLRGDLSAVGIGGFSGNIGFSANLSGGRGGAASGGGGIDIQEPRLIDPEGTIAEVIAEVLTDRNDINLAVQYEHVPGTDDTFSITTNIGDLIATALRRTAERYIRQAVAAIEKALREKLSAYLDERWVSREDLDSIFAAVKGDKAAIERLKTSLEEKKNEAERKIRGAAEEAINKAEEEVRRQAEDARRQTEDAAKKALQNAVPGIKLPF
ncbi:MAG: hypothetical protein LBP29_04820 [Treponema sp.]|jgi:uncharacterized protein (TIGR03545 family)|nr:hypothetical protein [Treponema sp.]